MKESKKPLKVYAFEGINASGKSTIIKEISSWYFDHIHLCFWKRMNTILIRLS